MVIRHASLCTSLHLTLCGTYIRTADVLNLLQFYVLPYRYVTDCGVATICSACLL